MSSQGVRCGVDHVGNVFDGLAAINAVIRSLSSQPSDKTVLHMVRGKPGQVSGFCSSSDALFTSPARFPRYSTT